MRTASACGDADEAACADEASDDADDPVDAAIFGYQSSSTMLAECRRKKTRPRPSMTEDHRRQARETGSDGRANSNRQDRNASRKVSAGLRSVRR